MRRTLAFPVPARASPDTASSSQAAQTIASMPLAGYPQCPGESQPPCLRGPDKLCSWHPCFSQGCRPLPSARMLLPQRSCPSGPAAPQSTHYPILILAFGNDPNWSLRIGQKGPERLDRPGYPPIPLEPAEVTHEGRRRFLDLSRQGHRHGARW